MKYEFGFTGMLLFFSRYNSFALFELSGLPNDIIISLSSSRNLSSGASGPSRILKQDSKRFCALSSADFNNLIEAVGPPDEVLAQTTPVVI